MRLPPKTSLFHPVTLLATWGGAGRLKGAPGTWGSLAALPFAWVIHGSFGHLVLLASAVAVFFVGWWVSVLYMRAANTAHDPQEIVIDEVAGQWLLLSLLPHSLPAYAAGFVLFRLFDMLKPWPISLADRKVSGGLGVMLDDIMAACYPVVILMALNWLGAGIDIAALLRMLE